jgi:hypothetical protein
MTPSPQSRSDATSVDPMKVAPVINSFWEKFKRNEKNLEAPSSLDIEYGTEDPDYLKAQFRHARALVWEKWEASCNGR